MKTPEFDKHEKSCALKVPKKDLERDRRNKIKQTVLELGKLIPNQDESFTCQLNILQKTLSYLKSLLAVKESYDALKIHEEELGEEIEQLKILSINLKRKNEHLLSLLRAYKISPKENPPTDLSEVVCFCKRQKVSKPQSDLLSTDTKKLCFELKYPKKFNSIAKDQKKKVHIKSPVILRKSSYRSKKVNGSHLPKFSLKRNAHVPESARNSSIQSTNVPGIFIIQPKQTEESMVYQYKCGEPISVSDAKAKQASQLTVFTNALTNTPIMATGPSTSVLTTSSGGISNQPTLLVQNGQLLLPQPIMQPQLTSIITAQPAPVNSAKLLFIAPKSQEEPPKKVRISRLQSRGGNLGKVTRGTHKRKRTSSIKGKKKLKQSDSEANSFSVSVSPHECDANSAIRSSILEQATNCIYDTDIQLMETHEKGITNANAPVAGVDSKSQEQSNQGREKLFEMSVPKKSSCEAQSLVDPSNLDNSSVLGNHIQNELNANDSEDESSRSLNDLCVEGNASKGLDPKKLLFDDEVPLEKTENLTETISTSQCFSDSQNLLLNREAESFASLISFPTECTPTGDTPEGPTLLSENQGLHVANTELGCGSSKLDDRVGTADHINSEVDVASNNPNMSSNEVYETICHDDPKSLNNTRQSAIVKATSEQEVKTFLDLSDYRKHISADIDQSISSSGCQKFSGRGPLTSSSSSVRTVQSSNVMRNGLPVSKTQDSLKPLRTNAKEDYGSKTSSETNPNHHLDNSSSSREIESEITASKDDAQSTKVNYTTTEAFATKADGDVRENSKLKNPFNRDGMYDSMTQQLCLERNKTPTIVANNIPEQGNSISTRTSSEAAMECRSQEKSTESSRPKLDSLPSAPDNQDLTTNNTVIDEATSTPSTTENNFITGVKLSPSVPSSSGVHETLSTTYSMSMVTTSSPVVVQSTKESDAGLKQTSLVKEGYKQKCLDATKSDCSGFMQLLEDTTDIPTIKNQPSVPNHSSVIKTSLPEISRAFVPDSFLNYTKPSVATSSATMSYLGVKPPSIATNLSSQSTTAVRNDIPNMKASVANENNNSGNQSRAVSSSNLMLGVHPNGTSNSKSLKLNSFESKWNQSSVDQISTDNTFHFGLGSLSANCTMGTDFPKSYMNDPSGDPSSVDTSRVKPTKESGGGSSSFNTAKEIIRNFEAMIEPLDKDRPENENRIDCGPVSISNSFSGVYSPSLGPFSLSNSPFLPQNLIFPVTSQSTSFPTPAPSDGAGQGVPPVPNDAPLLNQSKYQGDVSGAFPSLSWRRINNTSAQDSTLSAFPNFWKGIPDNGLYGSYSANSIGAHCDKTSDSTAQMKPPFQGSHYQHSSIEPLHKSIDNNSAVNNMNSNFSVEPLDKNKLTFSSSNNPHISNGTLSSNITGQGNFLSVSQLVSSENSNMPGMDINSNDPRRITNLDIVSSNKAGSRKQISCSKAETKNRQENAGKQKSLSKSKPRSTQGNMNNKTYKSNNFGSDSSGGGEGVSYDNYFNNWNSSKPTYAENKSQKVSVKYSAESLLNDTNKPQQRNVFGDKQYLPQCIPGDQYAGVQRIDPIHEPQFPSVANHQSHLSTANTQPSMNNSGPHNAYSSPHNVAWNYMPAITHIPPVQSVHQHSFNNYPTFSEPSRHESNFSSHSYFPFASNQPADSHSNFPPNIHVKSQNHAPNLPSFTPASYNPNFTDFNDGTKKQISSTNQNSVQSSHSHTPKPLAKSSSKKKTDESVASQNMLDTNLLFPLPNVEATIPNDPSFLSNNILHSRSQSYASSPRHLQPYSPVNNRTMNPLHSIMKPNDHLQGPRHSVTNQHELNSRDLPQQQIQPPSSVTNFNLSTIFPEFNGKSSSRNLNSHQTNSTSRGNVSDNAQTSSNCVGINPNYPVPNYGLANSESSNSISMLHSGVPAMNFLGYSGQVLF